MEGNFHLLSSQFGLLKGITVTSKSHGQMMWKPCHRWVAWEENAKEERTDKI